MNHELMFVKGNQKNFIRLSLEDRMAETYEFQMLMHNRVKSILPFQKRSQNGIMYLYYDVNGTQSLDILAQTQKLKRTFFKVFAQQFLALCKDIQEYMLAFTGVVLDPKFIMYKAETCELQFVYRFSETESGETTFGDLLEYCIDYLDYSDRLLSECVFKLYEHLQDLGENASFETELGWFINALSEEERAEKELIVEEKINKTEIDERNLETAGEADYSESAYDKAKQNRRGELLLLLFADLIVLVFWKPLTILKICFFLSFGLLLLALYIYLGRGEKDRLEKHKKEAKEIETVYINEYEKLTSQGVVEEDGTQFIRIENMQGMLYNLQGLSPQYIYITENLQLIGKEQEKVQVCILADGISRVHASIIRKGETCVIEDLCSTNGTWVNGKNIGIREPYVLKEGDRVCFASTEYIFR